MPKMYRILTQPKMVQEKTKIQIKIWIEQTTNVDNLIFSTWHMKCVVSILVSFGGSAVSDALFGVYCLLLFFFLALFLLLQIVMKRLLLFLFLWRVCIHIRSISLAHYKVKPKGFNIRPHACWWVGFK